MCTLFWIFLKSEILYLSGLYFDEIFNFIQTGPGHTVYYDSCWGRYYQPILIHFQLATLPKFDYRPFSVQNIPKCKLLRNVNYNGLIISKQFRNKPVFQRKYERLLKFKEYVHHFNFWKGSTNCPRQLYEQLCSPSVHDRKIIPF